MIEATDLTKSYGQKLAVDHLSFQAQPGMVTGFLGPNGAGIVIIAAAVSLRRRDA
jgi:ABC-2 type transport system ATP-binding protein